MIKFTKMHGLGNSFMVIDGVRQKINLTPSLIKQLSNVDTGIGFDQCLLIETDTQGNADFLYRIFNKDGSEIGQCGNGARCVAKFLFNSGLTNKRKLTLSTSTTSIVTTLNQDDSVTVKLSKPLLEPAQIPIQSKKIQQYYTVSIKLDDSDDETTINFHALNVGNPHAVLNVDDCMKIDIAKLGALLTKHAIFPEEANIGFMQILSEKSIKLRVFERGSGETKACGSGAVAAAIAGMLYHKLKDNITIHMPGGELIVSWPDKKDAIFLTGPATFIYEGVYPQLPQKN